MKATVPSKHYLSMRMKRLPEITTIIRQDNSRDSVVGIATGYGLDDRGVGVGVPVVSRNLSSQRRPERLWGPSSFLYPAYRRLFPRG
jgi:hypothetical protein